MEGEETNGKERKMKFGFFHSQSITVYHIYSSPKYLKSYGLEEETDLLIPKASVSADM